MRTTFAAEEMPLRAGNAPAVITSGTSLRETPVPITSPVAERWYSTVGSELPASQDALPTLPPERVSVMFTGVEARLSSSVVKPPGVLREQ